MNPISLPLAELKPALAGLGKIISRRSTLPVLGCIRIERTKTHRIELIGTDLDTTAIVQLEAEAQGEPMAFLVPYEDLNNVAKSCGKEDSLSHPGRETGRHPVPGRRPDDRTPLRVDLG